MAVLDLRLCARAFSSCGKRGPLFMAVRGPLTTAAPPVAEHRLQTRRLSNCGSRAELLRGMWGLPRPGLEPVSPALAGRFSTTAPPGKPSPHIIVCRVFWGESCYFENQEHGGWVQVSSLLLPIYVTLVKSHFASPRLRTLLCKMELKIPIWDYGKE